MIIKNIARKWFIAQFYINNYLQFIYKKCQCNWLFIAVSNYLRRYILYISQEGKGWINLLEGKSVLLVAKCSANRHSSPFSTANSGIRVDLFDGTRCALQFRALVRSMRDRYGTPLLRIVSSLNTCIAFRRREQKAEGKKCEREKS